MQQTRPNVLVLMVDQQRADSLGCYGGFGAQVCRTPRLDRLAAEGVRFERAYTPSPLCSPARASLLTGLWPTHHGMIFNSVGREGDFRQRARLPDDMPVLGRLFQDAGYRTAYFGKWHVGTDDDIRRLGFAEGPRSTESRAPEIPSMRNYPLLDPVQRRWLQNPTVYSAVTTADGEAHREIWICRRAQDWLRRHAAEHPDEPFFCFVSTPGPHWPCVVPERYAALYDWRTVPLPGNLDDTLEGKPAAHRVYRDEAGESFSLTEDEWRKCLARYYAFVTLIDDHFGQTLDVLEELGVAGDTVVVYVSDHGDIMGAHRLFDKGPFMYEETVRIPLIMRWPGRMPVGRVIDRFASTIDVMPMLLEAVGLSAPENPYAPGRLDGHSLWSLIQGETPADWPDDAYSQFHGHGASRGLYDVRMLRTERHKFVYYPHDIDELYDEQDDPWELRNLALEPEWQPLREELQERLVRRMHEADDPLWHWMKQRPRPRGRGAASQPGTR
ncbi:MAG: sulfatase-like hydrolase/transferase [Chloroflexi bacterium]|nr:sulfatase-like hydrolase/transferase [Chloroflexota bacterium]